MNKNYYLLVMTGCVGRWCFFRSHTTYEAQARKTKPETSTDITIKRAPGQSVVMTMMKF